MYQCVDGGLLEIDERTKKLEGYQRANEERNRQQDEKIQKVEEGLVTRTSTLEGKVATLEQMGVSDKNKDKEQDAVDKAMQEKDKQLEAKDKQFEEKIRVLDDKVRALDDKVRELQNRPAAPASDGLNNAEVQADLKRLHGLIDDLQKESRQNADYQKKLDDKFVGLNDNITSLKGSIQKEIEKSQGQQTDNHKVVVDQLTKLAQQFDDIQKKLYVDRKD
jgi:DNA repair exonuclease SbcCD ATPase subunit